MNKRRLEILKPEVYEFGNSICLDFEACNLKCWVFEKVESSDICTGTDEEARDIFFKILDVNFISIKKHEMEIW